MLHCKLVKTFDGYEVFRAAQQIAGRDVEGAFNEIHCPPQDGAIMVAIPEMDEFEYYDFAEIAVFKALMFEGGLKCGEYCWISVSY